MIFKQWQQVMDGTKTQTRRIVKPGDKLIRFPDPIWGGGVRWIVGRTYAVQPGRTQKAIGRIEIMAIRLEHVQDISEEDAIAEGCPGLGFSVSGLPVGRNQPGLIISSRDQYIRLWARINTRKGERWEDNPLVWVLEFRLVTP